VSAHIFAKLDNSRLGSDGLGFLAAFERHVAHPELHADFFQEVVRGRAPCEDPDEVVGNFLIHTVDFDDHAFGLDFDGH